MEERHEENEWRLLIATPDHTAVLLALQDAFHQYTPATTGEYSFAYEVPSDPFSATDFRAIIERQECIILFHGDEPAGYLLADTCSQTLGLRKYNEAIEDLITEDQLDPGMRHFPRYLELLHPSLYQEGFIELRWQLLGNFILLLKEKYGGICHVLVSQADKLMEKIRLGWKIAFDNGIFYYLVWDFSDWGKTQSS